MMKKIRDRLMAGVVAGLCANVVKMLIEHTSYALGTTDETGMKKAAGFFLPSRKIMTARGRIIGFIGDNTIAALLGVSASYLLSLTGRDYSTWKGLAIGNLSWSVLYGVLAQFGATKVRSKNPNTYLTSMISHTAFGVMETYLLNKLTDPGLFEPDPASLGEPEEIPGETVDYGTAKK